MNSNLYFKHIFIVFINFIFKKMVLQNGFSYSLFSIKFKYETYFLKIKIKYEERYEGTAIVVQSSPVYPVRRVIPNLKAVKRSKPYPLDTWIINLQKGDLMDRSIFLEKKNISQINLSFKNIYMS